METHGLDCCNISQCLFIFSDIGNILDFVVFAVVPISFHGYVLSSWSIELGRQGRLAMIKFLFGPFVQCDAVCLGGRDSYLIFYLLMMRNSIRKMFELFWTGPMPTRFDLKRVQWALFIDSTSSNPTIIIEEYRFQFSKQPVSASGPRPGHTREQAKENFSQLNVIH